MRNPLRFAHPMRDVLVLPSALLFIFSGCLSYPLHAQEKLNAIVPICANIQLAATYLPNHIVTGAGRGSSRSGPNAGGPAFQFAIHNGTDEAVSLVMPVPTSAHWYAREGSRWSWRASNGAGGSPVDAMNPQGRMFAFRVHSNGQRADNSREAQTEKLVVEAHAFVNWELKVAENPVLKFKPSCTRCNHPGDREFRVVFAYAVLPGGDEAGGLSCGLRTGPVVVPASYANIAAPAVAQSASGAPRGTQSLEKPELAKMP